MIGDLAAAAAMLLGTVAAVAVSRCYGRRVAARLAQERADEVARREWSAVFDGPRRPGEVYA